METEAPMAAVACPTSGLGICSMLLRMGVGRFISFAIVP